MAASGYAAAERAAIEAAFELARRRYGDATTAEGEPWLARATGLALHPLLRTKNGGVDVTLWQRQVAR